MANNNLNYDVFEQTLVFLPLKSLLRFKAVCKYTRDLISSSEFVQRHDAIGSNRVVSQIHLTQNPYRTGAGYEYGKVPWSITIPSVNSERSSIHVGEFNSPFKPQYILGSCNGVLLVTIGDKSFLWNPSTRESASLCRDGIWNVDRHISLSVGVLVGLGYDSAGDYKVVLYVHSYGWEQQQQGHTLLIYNCRTGTKKNVAQDLDREVYGTRRGVTVKGCPHWSVSKHNAATLFAYHGRCHDRVVLIYFDIVEEKLQSLSTPIQWFCDYPEKEPCLGTLSGRLCATLTKYVYSCKTYTTDVWVMNELGVEDSWTKLFVVSDSLSFRPLGFVENGDEVVLVSDKGNIVSYNLMSGQLNVIKETAGNINCYLYQPREFQFVEYTQSLVSPRTFAKINRKV